MKTLIGIGDSWTQGVGGVPIEFFDRWNGRVDKTDEECGDILYPYEIKNSWVNVLGNMLECRSYNLGMRGYGNRGAVKNLYYYDVPWDEITEGWLIFLLSGRTRFDIMNQYSSNNRRRFLTLYPHDTTEQYKWYLKNLYSDHVATQETLMCILEADMFAKSKGLKFLFGYSFDNCSDLIQLDKYDLSKKIDWSNCINPETSFFNKLAALEGTKPDWNYYMSLPRPSKYITNCVHPTIEGYKIIAEDMYKKISDET